MAGRLTPNVIRTVKATAPVVAPHAKTITGKFYARMFRNNPEVFQFFNRSNQREGRQPQALADAVVAYASHIDNLGAILPAVGLMVEKHCALGVQRQHYKIVYDNLMPAVAEVLGDALTPDVAHAWSEAVLHLADLLASAEETRYNQVAQLPGGWRGARPFRIARVVDEAHGIRSLYFTPQDKGALPRFAKPGQYITVAENPIKDKEPLFAPRHYTISGWDNDSNSLRITVRHHEGDERADIPAGTMSSFLHSCEVGDTVHLHPPFGAHQFVAEEKATAKDPVVFISAGIGVTPTTAMLPTAAQTGRPLFVFHGAQTPQHFALRNEINKVLAAHDGRSLYCYDSVSKSTKLADNERASTLTPENVVETLGSEQAVENGSFYLCGSPAFMQTMFAGLSSAGAKRIRYEAFGPHVYLTK